MSFSQLRFDHYARELSLAIYDLSLESRTPFHELTQDLRNVVLRDKLSHARRAPQRIANAIEAEADWLIAEEKAMKARIAEAFDPHKEILGEAKSELQAIKDALRLMSNGGPA